MAVFTQIDNPELFFQTVLWNGNSSTQSITLGGSENMQPDFVWAKARTGTDPVYNHALYNSVIGATKTLRTNNGTYERTLTAGLTSFDSNGFSLGDDGHMNLNGNTNVAWCWKAGTSFSNDASSTGVGSIDSSGSVNDTAGFSITSYTGTGTAGTIKHGLSTAPQLLIVKMRSQSDGDGATMDWSVFHPGLGSNDYRIRFNSTDTHNDDSTYWNSTAPTSSVFSVGTDNSVNQSGKTYICYAFSEKQGYSRISSYIGNGADSGNGPFVYLGFKPAFFLLKESSNADNWIIMDNKRLGYNPRNDHLFPNLNVAEYATDRIHLHSTGIKIIDSDGSINTNGATYIYYAFAEAPFVNSKGVPSTAR